MGEFFWDPGPSFQRCVCLAKQDPVFQLWPRVWKQMLVFEYHLDRFKPTLPLTVSIGRLPPSRNVEEPVCFGNRWNFWMFDPPNSPPILPRGEKRTSEKRQHEYYMGVSKNRCTPKSSILIGFFPYKPSILGYHYFWKHQYNKILSLSSKLHVFRWNCFLFKKPILGI